MTLHLSPFVSRLFGSIAGLFLASVLSQAAVIDGALLLDFGPTTTATSINSPWRNAQTSLTSDTYNRWNTIGAANSSSLVYANGDSATGVSLRLGSASSTTSLTFSSASINATAVTGSQAAGAFTSPVAKDGIFTLGSANTESKGVGVQIGGLAAGSYSVYIVARNTNSSDSIANMQASAYVSGSAIDTLALAQSGATTGTMTNGSSSSSWVSGTNYVLLSSITITSGDYLNLYTIGLGGGGTPDYRGFLNSIEIVPTAIPEPSTWALILGGGALALVGLRRFRRKI